MALVLSRADDGVGAGACAGLAGVGLGAGVVVVADGAIGDGGVDDAGYRIAAVFGTRVAVVGIERRPGFAGAAAVADRGAQADVAAAATGASGFGHVLDALDRVAAVGGAGIAVVGVERWARLTATTAVAQLDAIAHVAIGAARAGRDSDIGDTADRVAAVGRARVLIVGIEWRARHAGAGRAAHLGAVTDVAVGATSAWGGLMLYARNRIARVDGARVLVVGIERGAGLADGRGVADFGTIANIVVATTGTYRERNMSDAGNRVATIGRARVAVVDGRRCTGHTDARAITALAPIAQVSVGTG